MRQIRLIKGFLTVGVWTFASRILGFVRDILLAAYLGSGPVAQAFIVAFSLPNMFRRIFAEGAFNTAFVPIFAKKYEAGENPHGFAQQAFSGLAFVLLILSVIAHFAMPFLVMAMASGFHGDERFDLAVEFGRITFPYILFISLTALFSGVLNATGRFAVAAAAPTLLNLCFIFAMLAGVRYGWSLGHAQAWAAPVAGIAQLALVWVAAARAGFPLKLTRPRFTPDMKRLIVVATPAMLAGGVVQINLLVGRQVASYYDGAVAWLSNADRIYQLPLGVIAIAVGVVLTAELPRRLRAGDMEGSRHAFNRAAEFSLSLTLPAAVALMVIAQPIISVLFQRGAYSATDATNTAFALMVYGAGLPAFSFQKVMQPVFYAREDTRRPFHYALVAMVVNAALAIGLSPFIGFIAAALGTTLASWAMVGQLWLGSRPMGIAVQFDDRFRDRAGRIVLASVAMGVVLGLAAWAMGPLLSREGVRFLALMALVALGMVTYFGLGTLIGAFRLSDFRSALKRQR